MQWWTKLVVRCDESTLWQRPASSKHILYQILTFFDVFSSFHMEKIKWLKWDLLHRCTSNKGNINFDPANWVQLRAICFKYMNTLIQNLDLLVAKK